MADEAGFRLRGEFYPWPEYYDMGDAVVIERVTGMDMEEFAEAAGEAEYGTTSMSVMAGMIAAAVRHKHPSWSPKRIAQLVAVRMDDSSSLEIIAADVEPEPEGAEVVPLPQAADDGAQTSRTSSETSTDTAGRSSSAETRQSSSGDQTSLTSSA